MTLASSFATHIATRPTELWQQQQTRAAFTLYRIRRQHLGWTEDAAACALQCRLLAITLRVEAHDRQVA